MRILSIEFVGGPMAGKGEIQTDKADFGPQLGEIVGYAGREDGVYLFEADDAYHWRSYDELRERISMLQRGLKRVRISGGWTG